MKYAPPNKCSSPDELREKLQAIDPTMNCVSELDAARTLGAPKTVYGRTVGNRFAIHPMEGWDGTREGGATDLVKRRWRRFGRSGAKLIWGGEAFAVDYRGRANPNQLCYRKDEDSLADLKTLLAEVKEGHEEIGQSTDDLMVGLQLTHSGRFSRPDGDLEPKLVDHHAALDDKFSVGKDAPVLTDAELEAIGQRFIGAAKLAQKAGYDFVDVKCCHGYLLHELLGARNRPGPYGGSFENRTKLFVSIVQGIRDACPGLAIGVRISATDVYPFSARDDDRIGYPKNMEQNLPYTQSFGVDANNPLQPDFDDPFRFFELVESLGITLANITVGSPYYCPHIQRPAAFPPSDGYQPPADPLESVVKHIQTVRACKERFPQFAFVASGYSYLQEYVPHVAQYEVEQGYTDFVGLGRMVLSYPEMPRDILDGKTLTRKLICRTFSDCTTAPRNKMISGCYPLDEYYKKLPEAKEVRALRPKSGP